MNIPTPKETETLMLRMHREGILTDELFRKLHHHGNGILTHFGYLQRLTTNLWEPNSRNERLALKLKQLDEFTIQLAEQN